MCSHAFKRGVDAAAPATGTPSCCVDAPGVLSPAAACYTIGGLPVEPSVYAALLPDTDAAPSIPGAHSAAHALVGAAASYSGVGPAVAGGGHAVGMDHAGDHVNRRARSTTWTALHSNMGRSRKGRRSKALEGDGGCASGVGAADATPVVIGRAEMATITSAKPLLAPPTSTTTLVPLDRLNQGAPQGSASARGLARSASQPAHTRREMQEGGQVRPQPSIR